MLNNTLNPKDPLFYLEVITVFVRSESSIMYQVLLVCTTLGCQCEFLGDIRLRATDIQCAQTFAGCRSLDKSVLGAVLMALGIRLWLTKVPN